ncbi:ribulose-phosphate 3-epimerase [Luteitalea sp. TBR-22]|uniref:ribulose-phosphate 3-epimerase n=1 Tax=Luteitalea sp. TBR-22 TaxID=2802971 RepID=UPI00351D0F32
MRLAPSVLSADFAALGEDVRKVAAAGADWIHVDVMDGRFVPNISIGLPVVAALKRVSPVPLDVHLMIVEPERYVDQFVEAGAASLSVHVEATDHLHRLVHRIRQLGARPGVAINPATSLDTLAEIAPDLDIVILMSVNPGFGGQAFIERSYDRLRRLRDFLDRAGSQALITVDGGVDPGRAEAVVAAGGDVLVAGAAVFAAADPAAAMADLRAAGTRGWQARGAR